MQLSQAYNHMADKKKPFQKVADVKNTEIECRSLIGLYVSVRTTALGKSQSTRFRCIIICLIHPRDNHTCTESLKAVPIGDNACYSLFQFTVYHFPFHYLFFL